MRSIATRLLVSWTLIICATSVRALQIDSFETAQSVGPPTPPDEPIASSTISGAPGAIGASRTLTVVGLATASIGGGVLEVAQPSSGAVTWDLSNPLDLTEGGATDSLLLTVQAQTLPVTAVFVLSSDCVPGTPCSSAGSIESLDLDGPGTYRFRFSSFGQFFDQPVDVTKVKQIHLEFDLSPGGSIQVGPVATAPEPSSVSSVAALALVLWRGRRSRFA